MTDAFQLRLRRFLTNRTARQAAQMTALRFLGLRIGTVAHIYSARQFGPEKLGISGMAQASRRGRNQKASREMSSGKLGGMHGAGLCRYQ